MRALIWKKYGSTAFMDIETIAQPKCGADQIKIKVNAASVNSWDAEMVSGQILVRMFSPFSIPHPVLGADMSGEIVEIGHNVEGYQVGEAVFGDLSEHGWGGFAEYCVGPARAFARKPEALSHEEAASVPQAGTLASQALDLFPALAAQHRVLIVGGGGGVGAFAIQMAKRAGAHVTAIDRAHKLDFMKKMGADEVRDCAVHSYETHDYRDEDQKFDFILDPVARKPREARRGALRDGGLMVVIGGSVGALLSAAFFMLFRKIFRGDPSHQSDLKVMAWQPRVADILRVANLVADKSIVAPIAQVYPLEAGASAIESVHAGQALGKPIVSPHLPVTR